MNRQEYKFIDATPDENYPLRILKAYRKDCDFIWSSSSSEIKEDSPLIKAMNDAQHKRAEVLDKAIRILENEPS